MKQLRFIGYSVERNTFINLFLILITILLFFPFMSTFNDLLTRFVINTQFYRYIQIYIVPFLVRSVAVLLTPFQLNPSVAGEYLRIAPANGTVLMVEIAWNCLGWQSLLFFVLTGWVGLQGDSYTLGSKIKAWIIGFLGTFLINLIRISIVVLITVYLNQFLAQVFHEYASILFVLLWLFFFWWYSYRYVLVDTP